MKPGVENLFRLDGKTALVTGAAKGLGRLFSQTLAEAGAHVICADFDADSLRKTSEEFRALGYEVTPMVCDVSSFDSVSGTIGAIASRFGGLNIAVNNAGIVTRPSRLHEITLEEWDRLMAVDLTGAFLCMKEELALMITQGEGSIVNIVSVAGIRGVAPEHKPRANYVAAKHGLVGLTKQAALEYAREGIRVNGIAPGWFGGTDLSHERPKGEPGTEEHLDQTRNNFVPLGRKGDLKELKGLILYLVSDASSYVTGQIFAIDGGVTAR